MAEVNAVNELSGRWAINTLQQLCPMLTDLLNDWINLHAGAEISPCSNAHTCYFIWPSAQLSIELLRRTSCQPLTHLIKEALD